MKMPGKRQGAKKDPWLRDLCDAESLFSSKWIKAFDKLPPSINITENDNCFYIDIVVPGYNREEFKVNIEDNIITITAGMTLSATTIKGHQATGVHEHYPDAFSHSFRLPENIKEDLVSAAYKNGILQLYIPKHIPVYKKEIAVE